MKNVTVGSVWREYLGGSVDAEWERAKAGFQSSTSRYTVVDLLVFDGVVYAKLDGTNGRGRKISDWKVQESILKQSFSRVS